MKIQEMRSGISHLTKMMEIDRQDETIELPPPAERFDAPRSVAPEPDAEVKVKRSTPCDLDEPRWSVVSFDQTEAGGLTYRQAALLQNELELNYVTGLCIVTDEAAKRIGR
jgi:hypothetical protein